MTHSSTRRKLFCATVLLALLGTGTWIWQHFARGPIHRGNAEALVDAINDKSGKIAAAEVEELLGGPGLDYRDVNGRKLQIVSEDDFKAWGDENDAIITVYFDKRGRATHANAMIRISWFDRLSHWVQDLLGLI